MTAQRESIDQEWATTLAGEPQELQRKAMEARYMELVRLSEEERQSRLMAMTLAEYSLPDDQLRPITESRMRTFIALDPEAGRTIATSLDAVMKKVSGNIAWRRVSLVQTLSREFSLEDTQKLKDLVPGVFNDTIGGVARLNEQPGPTAVAVAEKKKPFWAFWRK